MFFGFSLVVVPCVLFVCLPFLLWFVFDGTAHWTVYWSITSAFEAIDVQTALHDNLQFIFLLRLNVCNDLAKAMKALDGKKTDASQDDDSDVAYLLKQGQAPHTGVWTASTTPQHLPASLARLFDEETLSHHNVGSCLISAILAALLKATAPEEFGIPECTTTVKLRTRRPSQMRHHSSQQFTSILADVQSHRSCQVSGTRTA